MAKKSYSFGRRFGQSSLACHKFLFHPVRDRDYIEAFSIGYIYVERVWLGENLRGSRRTRPEIRNTEEAEQSVCVCDISFRSCRWRLASTLLVSFPPVWELIKILSSIFRLSNLNVLFELWRKPNVQTTIVVDFDFNWTHARILLFDMSKKYGAKSRLHW